MIEDEENILEVIVWRHIILLIPKETKVDNEEGDTIVLESKADIEKVPKSLTLC